MSRNCSAGLVLAANQAVAGAGSAAAGPISITSPASFPGCALMHCPHLGQPSLRNPLS